MAAGQTSLEDGMGEVFNTVKTKLWVWNYSVVPASKCHTTAFPFKQNH